MGVAAVLLEVGVLGLEVEEGPSSRYQGDLRGFGGGMARWEYPRPRLFQHRELNLRTLDALEIL